MLPSYYEARIKLIDDLVHPGQIDFQSTLEWFQWVKKLAFDDASFSSTCCKGNVTRFSDFFTRFYAKSPRSGNVNFIWLLCKGCQNQRLIDIFVYKFRKNGKILDRFFKTSFGKWKNVEQFMMNIQNDEFSGENKRIEEVG